MGQVVPVEQAESARSAAREKAMASYYITSGKKLDKAVALLAGHLFDENRPDGRRNVFLSDG